MNTFSFLKDLIQKKWLIGLVLLVLLVGAVAVSPSGLKVFKGDVTSETRDAEGMGGGSAYNPMDNAFPGIALPPLSLPSEKGVDVTAQAKQEAHVVARPNIGSYSKQLTRDDCLKQGLVLGQGKEFKWDSLSQVMYREPECVPCGEDQQIGGGSKKYECISIFVCDSLIARLNNERKAATALLKTIRQKKEQSLDLAKASGNDSPAALQAIEDQYRQEEDIAIAAADAKLEDLENAEEECGM